ncbi:unnamed protein product [Adineta ricciae]|uniref:Uncharacterized protein n=2 Tax=Adineta ricciae TaxID=249248 RepID=A0A814DWU1_ADIRI|nr:unnamed protein product [Adineta ricciae]
MKQRRNKLDQKTEKEIDEHMYIELDLQCCCPQSQLNNNASIQFSRRYLQCQSSMPVAILRSYIQLILPHSSMTQVTFYDSQHRLLHDQQLLSSLQPPPSSSSSIHIPIRFSLFNTITSLAHCSCSSSTPTLPPSISSSFSSPTVIRRETIDQTLSTCSSLHHPSSMIYSPCLSSSSASVSSPPTLSASSSGSVSIVNLLTPPPSSSSCHSSTVNEHDSSSAATAITDQAIIDEITSQFGEICPAVVKKNRNRLSKKTVAKISSNIPLDLSMKKRPLSALDTFSSRPKWIKI